jgi:hypothetical protein
LQIQSGGAPTLAREPRRAMGEHPAAYPGAYPALGALGTPMLTSTSGAGHILRKSVGGPIPAPFHTLVGARARILDWEAREGWGWRGAPTETIGLSAPDGPATLL